MERPVDGGPERDEVLRFYDASVGQVFAYAMRLTGGDRHAAEELVQDTYLTLLRQQRDGRVDGVGVGWAITTCRHRYIDDLRRRRRRDDRERRIAPAPTDVEPSDTPAIVALRLLPPDQRAAMVLRYVDELPVAEIAAAIGRTVHATESLLARGRASLRRHLDRKDQR